MMWSKKIFILLTVFGLLGDKLCGQKATIREETRTFDTYSFSDPNPIPILTTNTKIYPYHKFEGYDQQPKPAGWKVITLENDYIQVFVLPEVGGKVWGAIDKSTGKEFIYRNEVMKFRNISMRGPWTSGGIEFNFGIIGHHPSTATPVDYVLEEQADGSVSCIVGGIDLPSRTQWRVNITLEPDKSYFETKVLWYNPTPYIQSYYNWMTAAAFATEDLEFYTPGHTYLKHSGEAKSWPLDQSKRDLSKYSENNFGPSKSYHVVGEYNDFFGGYYKDQKFGFGHWALYEEMPGQKLWLWALSRAGGIWEDLLTDEDGQYIEFQAGRLFDQYSPDAHQNPITQAPFPSYTYDSWRELWFPVNEIGGITEVSPLGVMHVNRNNNQITIGVNALTNTKGQLIAKVDNETVIDKPLHLQTAQVFTETFSASSDAKLDIRIEGMDLHYQSHSTENNLKRPFEYPKSIKPQPTTVNYQAGVEALEYRDFEKALKAFSKSLELDPTNISTRVALAELLLRSGRLSEACSEIQFALSLDTYHASANYVAGNVYRAQSDWVNALESFGWAARSMQFRSASYAQMAEISLARKHWQEASLFASKSLEYDVRNLRALQASYIAHESLKEETLAQDLLKRILVIDPLNHMARYEEGTLDMVLHNEFPQQSYVELAMDYYGWGQINSAKDLLKKSNSAVGNLWLAYINRDDNQKVEELLEEVVKEKIDFVFPYRRETLAVLEWAVQHNSHWKFKYYLGLTYWGKLRINEATRLLKDCQELPDEATFYLTRANILSKTEQSAEPDLKRAMELAPNTWRTWDQLIRFYGDKKQWAQQLKVASKAHRKWPENYNIGLSYAESLLYNGKYAACLKLLQGIQVLPFEGASGSRTIYEQAHLLQALMLERKGQHIAAISLLQQALNWPESLGVGKPFDPEQRKIEYLLAHCYEMTGDQNESLKYMNKVAAVPQISAQPTVGSLLSWKAWQQLNKPQKAQEMVANTKLEPDSKNAWQAWVVGHFNNDVEMTNQQTNHLIKEDPVNYEIMKQLISITTK